jgi:hypothetical protein
LRRIGLGDCGDGRGGGDGQGRGLMVRAGHWSVEDNYVGSRSLWEYNIRPTRAEHSRQPRALAAQMAVMSCSIFSAKCILKWWGGVEDALGLPSYWELLHQVQGDKN